MMPMHKLFGLGAGLLFFFAAAPTSTNYTLKSYDIGTGGNSSSSSTNYKLNGASGAQSTTLQTSTNYDVVSGVNATESADVPSAPALTNPSSYYDKLKLVLNIGGSPSDTKYLIAISSDGFITTNYIQTDHTAASSQAITNYQTYTTWGGASGFNILGLNPATTYRVKIKAIQGNFSGSSFGPIATAATVSPSLTLSLATTLTATPPFPVGFSTLAPGVVTNGAADAIVSLTTNADNGGSIYTRDTNTGLLSTLMSSTIPSATADLSVAGTGYGLQVISASQTAGGPFTSVSPFNGSANTVGGLTTTYQPILTTASPITSGNGTVRLMAKASFATPSASDYADVVTFIVAMTF
jgi:hypothetical protein